MIKPVFLVPIYNHGDTLLEVITQLSPYQINCLIVDDGSDKQTRQVIQQVQKQFTWVSTIALACNRGKGAAIINGFHWLLNQGYSHAIQIDADNQHNLQDIPKFLALLQKEPNKLISGASIYDQSIPKSRLHGRKITNFWVSIETWSNQITESMCGFRVYPLALLKTVIPKISGMRMDFDIEIIVKAYWHNIGILYIKTSVTYPIDGCSHFRLWRDNLSISWLHTRLFFSMFYYMPRLHLKRICSFYDTTKE